MSGIIAQNTLDSSGLIKSPEGGGGAWTFIKKITASASSDVSFVDGTSSVVLDGTYKLYVIYCNNIHLATDNQNLQVNFSVDTGSNYNVTKTTTAFDAYVLETGSGAVGYNAGSDLAQGTGAQLLTYEINLGADADQSCSGIMYLYDPANTTFTKKFSWISSQSSYADYMVNNIVSGICNTTSAVDAVQFTSTSGNIDAGDFVLLGLTI